MIVSDLLFVPTEDQLTCIRGKLFIKNKTACYQELRLHSHSFSLLCIVFQLIKAAAAAMWWSRVRWSSVRGPGVAGRPAMSSWLPVSSGCTLWTAVPTASWALPTLCHTARVSSHQHRAASQVRSLNPSINARSRLCFSTARVYSWGQEANGKPWSGDGWCGRRCRQPDLWGRRTASGRPEWKTNRSPSFLHPCHPPLRRLHRGLTPDLMVRATSPPQQSRHRWILVSWADPQPCHCSPSTPRTSLKQACSISWWIKTTGWPSPSSWPDLLSGPSPLRAEGLSPSLSSSTHWPPA